MDKKLQIDKILKNFTKNHNFIYSNAKKKRMANRKQYDQNKKTKQLQKSLSKDSFNQYLEDLYKDANK
jgi:hypothetical protein|tara:strand:- start:4196 stop:4399 length:204 start_codon:yes stop_codon:yes gene_type:complete